MSEKAWKVEEVVKIIEVIEWLSEYRLNHPGSGISSEYRSVLNSLEEIRDYHLDRLKDD